MIDSLLRFSLKNRLATLLLALAMAVAGYYAFSSLTVEAFPDPTDTQVQVITLYPGQPAEEVERRVSLPLERALNGTPGLWRLRSISQLGLSLVTLTFEEGVELLTARQQTMERLRLAALPEDAKPTLGPMATPIGEVYRYTLGGAQADPMTKRTVQDWVVRPQLLRVQGVADVVSYGGLVKEIHVQPHPARMAALGVGLTGLFDALKKGSANATGGYIERGREGFVIRSLGIFNSVEDIAGVGVALNRGVPVYVRDVATVSVGYSPRQGIVTRNSDEDAVQGIVLMRRGENPSVVLAALRKRVDELNTRILPKEITIDPFYDRTELVETTLRTVFRNLAEGAGLVVLVLFLFLLSMRAALVVSVAIPLSLLASFIYLRSRGMSANLLSMGAVDFGIIVDGAVILVEHLFHRMDDIGRPKGGKTRAEALLEVASEVARPTLFSLLIIIAAYLPIFSLQRVEGRIFAPMANTVVSALIGALLVSFTLIPLLYLVVYPKPYKPRRSILVRWAHKVHDASLGWSMRNPLPMLLLAGSALGSALLLLPRLGSEFLPELNEGALYVTFILPGSNSLSSGRTLVPEIKKVVSRTPEVTELLSQLGRPEDGTDPTLPNNLELFVRLKPPDQWREGKRTLDDLIEEMDKNLKEIPGLEYNFSQPIRDNVAENIAGQFGQIAMKIYGDDLRKLQSLADRAKAQISTVRGVADLGIVRCGELPQIGVRLNRQALARYGLSLADLQDYIETAMGGHVASELWEGERRFDVTVRLPKATREDVGAIRHIMIPMKNGTLLPLSAVAEVSITSGEAAISRENGRRYIGVRMNVRKRDLGSFVAEAQQKVGAALKLPAGYEVTWGGEFENQQRAMKRLQLVIPLALAITFLLLFSTFGTVFEPVIVLVSVPFALIGGVAGLAVAGLTLSVSAAVGFIALLGQAVLNGVLVVAAIKERLDKGEELQSSVVSGTRDRVRAVLITALLAALGLLPASLSHAIGSETQRPIAVVVVGGTISAALLTLIVLPLIYYWSARFRAALRARHAQTDDAS
jgi:heavy metal efflux system protein